MSMDYSKYPDNWKEISSRIRFDRAKGKCERCGAEHNTVILRSVVDASRFLTLDSDGVHRCPDGTGIKLSELPSEFEDNDHYTKVVLTVHHVGAAKPDGAPGDRHDKMDVREENLLALCQRCHFLADLDIHIEAARQERIARNKEKLEANGQLRLAL